MITKSQAKNRRRRERRFNAQNGICYWCDETMTLDLGRGHTMTVDHIVPKARGGFGLTDNKRAACLRCNQLKGAMSEKEFRLAYPNADAIERAYPMALADARARAGYRNANPAAFLGRLHALNADGETVAVFHPKDKT